MKGELPVYLFTDGDGILGLLVDISDEGCKIYIGKEQPYPEKEFTFTFLGETEKASPTLKGLKIRAEKVWQKDNIAITHKELGCRFLSSPEEQKLLIDAIAGKPDHYLRIEIKPA